MVRFGALLALAATGWVLISASLITVMSPVRVQTLQDFIAHVVLVEMVSCLCNGWLWAAFWLLRFLRPAWW